MVRFARNLVALSVSVAAGAILASWALAQDGSVSMVTLRTVTANAQQMVVLPSGQQVPLPGPGVDGSYVNVYIGNQGGYWYVDRTGQNYDLTPYVSQMHVSAGQASATNSNSGTSSDSTRNSSSGASAGETALAAGAGAALGAGATNAYDEYQRNQRIEQAESAIPYGYAVTSSGGRAYYTSPTGSSVYINSSNSGNADSGHASDLQKQEQWYKEQQGKNPELVRSWKSQGGSHNPFVARHASGAGAGGGHGPFGGGGPFAGRGDGAGGPRSGGRPGPSGGPFGRAGGPSGGQGGPFGGAPPFAGSGAPSGGPSGGPPPFAPGGGAPSPGQGGPPLGGRGMPGQGPRIGP